MYLFLLLLIYSFYFIFYSPYYSLILNCHWLGLILRDKLKPKIEKKISLSKGSFCLSHRGSHPVRSLMMIPSIVD